MARDSEFNDLANDFAREMQGAEWGAAPGRVQLGDWEDGPTAAAPALPDEFPDGPERPDLGPDLPQLGEATPDAPGLPEWEDTPRVALPEEMPGDPDYPVRMSRPRAAPAPGPPEFSQWSESDGSIVFEDGPGMAPEDGALAQPQGLPPANDLIADDSTEILSGHLGDILGAIEGLTAALTGGQGRENGRGLPQQLGLPTGPMQLPWSGMGDPLRPEDGESYASGASPSITDATNLSGLRGAGGHGGGSRYGLPHTDFLEPGKRLTGRG